MNTLLKGLERDVTKYIGNKLKTLTEIKKKAIELHTKFFQQMFIAKVEI